MNENTGTAGATGGTGAPKSASNGAEDAFVDARVMHAMALERLGAADIRDAAEKAWCATKRAADGLIIARTGQEPSKSPDTTRMLRQLSFDDPLVRPFSRRYSTARDQLHGDCFYSGLCEPVEETLRLIRETGDYIAEAERLGTHSAD